MEKIGFWRYERLCLKRAGTDCWRLAHQDCKKGIPLMVIAAAIGIVCPLLAQRADVLSNLILGLVTVVVFMIIVFLYALFRAPTWIHNDQVGEITNRDDEIKDLRVTHEIGLARVNAKLSASRKRENELRLLCPIADCPADEAIELIREKIPGWSDKSWDQIAEALMKGVIGGWLTLWARRDLKSAQIKIDGEEFSEYRLDKKTFGIYPIIVHRNGWLGGLGYFTDPEFFWLEIELRLSPLNQNVSPPLPTPPGSQTKAGCPTRPRQLTQSCNRS